MIRTEPDGTRWACSCALCRNQRKTGFGAFPAGQEPECSWCRSVRLEYGSYWYPITATNEHLFSPATTRKRPSP
jgi:hypothetical protein